MTALALELETGKNAYQNNRHKKRRVGTPAHLFCEQSKRLNAYCIGNFIKRFNSGFSGFDQVNTHIDHHFA